jgi:cellulose synthase/poly-beta-1,6-N-acetylglucosamine synthase-like glycosyltransferase
VSGHKVVVKRGADGALVEGEGLYWRWDQWQKAREGDVGSILASDGALHAVRRALFVPIRDPDAADDLAISARVPLQGARLALEPRAHALEVAPEDPAGEFRRKVRVTNASLRALLDLRGALWRSGWYSVELISHKVLRYLVPVFLLVALAASLALAPVHPAFAALAGAQLAFHLLAVAGHLLRDRRAGRWAPLALPYYFDLVNLAALCGIVSLLRGVRFGIWVPRGGLQP